MKSNFNEDIEFEVKVAEFLDNKFYGWLVENEPWFESYERVEDKTRQNKGTDLIATVRGWNESGDIKNVSLDEKCNSYYLNAKIPTFAFEVEYLKSHSSRKGWLFDKNKETDAYVLIWPSISLKRYADMYRKFGSLKVKKEWFKHIYPDDFTFLEIWIIRRNSLISLLKDNFGLSESTIEKDKNELIKHSSKWKIYRGDYSIQISNQLAEKPINIVLRKEAFCHIAYRYWVFDDRVIKLNGCNR